MDLRRLELLMQVSAFGSFSKAATVLGIAQPALGRQIQKLEEECGLRRALEYAAARPQLHTRLVLATAVHRPVTHGIRVVELAIKALLTKLIAQQDQYGLALP